MVSGSRLKDYRKQCRVSSTELAVELGKAHTSHVTRLESRDLTPLEFAESVTAIERIIARRTRNQTGIDEVLVPALGVAEVAIQAHLDRGAHEGNREEAAAPRRRPEGSMT